MCNHNLYVKPVHILYKSQIYTTLQLLHNIIFKMITRKQTLEMSSTSVSYVSSNTITKELGVGSWSTAAAILAGGTHARVVLIKSKPKSRAISVVLLMPKYVPATSTHVNLVVKIKFRWHIVPHWNSGAISDPRGHKIWGDKPTSVPQIGFLLRVEVENKITIWVRITILEHEIDGRSSVSLDISITSFADGQKSHIQVWCQVGIIYW